MFKSISIYILSNFNLIKKMFKLFFIGRVMVVIDLILGNVWELLSIKKPLCYEWLITAAPHVCLQVRSL